jgi:putative ABC transport system permease protein
MSLFDAVRYRLRILLRPGAFREERAEEIDHHLELESAEQRDADDARLAARRAFGNVTFASEERRMISGLAAFDSAEQDLRFVTRLLRRRATFAVVTIATIALGIGAAASIYSVADAVLFRSLAFPDPERLMSVHLERPAWKKNSDIARRWDRGTLSLPGFRAWRAGQQSFDDVAVWDAATAVVNGPASPEEVTVGRASASLLPTLSIRPALGAWISSADDVVGGAAVTVVGYETWIARFGADASVLGKSIDINGIAFTIIGVAPRGLSLDRAPTHVAYWIPAGRDSADATDRSSFSFQAIGRMKAGVSSSAARAEAGHILRAASGDDRIEGVALSTLHADQTRIVRRPLLILLGAALLLLVIACINVATLLLGEAADREQELRTRTALGATRRRLLRQLLTESVVLSSVGALFGVALAMVGTRIIVRTAPPSIPGINDVSVDARLLVLASIVAIATGVLFGLMPAVALSRAGGSLGAATGRFARKRGRGQRVLVACEVALSMVLLVGAGLLLRSFGKLTAVGFNPSSLYIVALRLPRSPFDDSIHARQLFADVQQRLGTIPEVAAVTITTTPPFRGSSSTSFEIEGRSSSRDVQTVAQRRVTSADFFGVAGIPIVAGRSYDDRDRAGAPLVVVVNQTLARREWPAGDAIGRRIIFMGSRAR